MDRYFDDSEYARRRDMVRDAMAKRGLDACLIASPENLYYLTGLDHMGYFAFQTLIFPVSGQPILITRAMERATVRDQVPDVRHVGYADGTDSNAPSADAESRLGGAVTVPTREYRRRPLQTPSAGAKATVAALHDAGLARSVLGIDLHSTFFPYAIADAIMDGTPEATWENLGNLVDDCRIVQSPAELVLTRRAADISESMMLSALAAAGSGVYTKEIMAAIYDALFRRGGTYPGFVPLVRCTRNLQHEHGTWGDDELRDGDLLFLEMAGCVRRYHAPMGRLVFIRQAPPGADAIDAICRDAMMAAAEAIKPGAIAGDVYAQWQGHLDRNRLSAYTRHHCGYSVGIGYPPSWSGSGVPVGLRAHSNMQLREGMVFHLMSWLLGSAQGDAFLSDTVVVTATGCEFLTRVDHRVYVR